MTELAIVLGALVAALVAGMRHQAGRTRRRRAERQEKFRQYLQSTERRIEGMSDEDLVDNLTGRNGRD